MGENEGMLPVTESRIYWSERLVPSNPMIQHLTIEGTPSTGFGNHFFTVEGMAGKSSPFTRVWKISYFLNKM